MIDMDSLELPHIMEAVHGALRLNVTVVIAGPNDVLGGDFELRVGDETLAVVSALALRHIITTAERNKWGVAPGYIHDAIAMKLGEKTDNDQHDRRNGDG